ncbi:C40 family peptidase [Rhodococcus kronopolitis]|uniref:C40 family peptidase n=1 Tax=Rhodococcus kronopolitis TaxID=1460226 RepID=A0ABV9FLX2_9NOCA
MASHKSARVSRLAGSVRGVLFAGAVAAGAVVLTATPALAQPINIPGIGAIEIPGQLPAAPQAPSVGPGPIASSHGTQALRAAESKLGSPYVWGATGPNSFDCSGLIQWAYKQAGVSVPRTTYDQANSGAPVSRGDLQPGDVVLFNGAEHVGIYQGNGRVVHAPTEGQPVKSTPVDAMPFYSARRF